MLLVDEERLSGFTEERKTRFLLQWLQELPQTIRDSTKESLKANQQKLVQQLQRRFSEGLPPPLRRLLGRALVAVYSAGNTLTLFDTVNRLTDSIKAKDEGGATVSANKLTAIECIGAIFEQHGRMTGTLFPDVVQALLKTMRNQEYRGEVLDCLRRVVAGLGSSSSTTHRDIYKAVRNGLTDKAPYVRSSAAKCALELAQHSTFLYSQELVSVSSCCLKALEGSNYEVRCAVSQLLGSLLSLTQKPLPPHTKGKIKLPTLDEALSVLSNGFVRGAGGHGPELLRGGSASREVRIGVTQAYVVFLSEMGGVWLERNLHLILQHVLELLSNPKTISTHIDAVYSRKCVSFILRSSFSKLLGESAQLLAATHLCQQVIQYSSSAQASGEETGGEGGVSEKAAAARQHMIVCAILEVGSLVYTLNTASISLVVGDSGSLSKDKPSKLLETLGAILPHPSLATRLAAAWCLRCIGLALPSQMTVLIGYMMEQLRACVSHPDALVGHSYALAALLSTAKNSNLGVPFATAEAVFSTGQQLVRTTSDNDKLARASAQSGWALIGAYLSLGPVYVRSQLKKVLSMWHSVFPHSHKELTTELKGGSMTSWIKLLDTRAGALSSVSSFLSSCSSIISPELTKRIMLPLDSALAMTAGIPSLVKVHGVQLKAAGAMLRLRLYTALCMLPPSAYEGSLNNLLRELVAEFTLADNMSSTTSSLLRSMCHHDDSILLGSWLEETDHQDVEEMLQPNSAAGSGALEHDPASTFLHQADDTALPGPLPLGVAVIDASIMLFGKVFPLVSHKHRNQLLSHFKECIKQAKSARQQALLINIFTAFLAALKGLVEAKTTLGDETLISTAYSLITGALASQDPMLRCAAGEALGRLSQVVGETSFVTQIVQMSVAALKSSREMVAKTGHSLVLGCLHRYVGGMGSGQHLQMSVSVLQSLVTDPSPVVQVWSLHALALIADSGGPLFRNHVDPTLSLVFSLLLNTPFVHTEIHRCLGKCLSALITTLGPELQIPTKNMSSMRDTCLTCCSIIRDHSDAVVQSNAISCLQQLQLFAPALVSLDDIVPHLYRSLDSSHLLLRQAAANCLRQFSQQDPLSVWRIVSKNGKEKGLEHTVLAKLDTERDKKLCFDLKEVLFSLLSSLAPSNPMKWLLLCNGVLSAASTQKAAAGGGMDPAQQRDDEDEDMAKFTSGEEAPVASSMAPRWPTKVFAVECSRKIYAVCRNDPAHFDLVLAAQSQKTRGGDYLVKHLSELVRTSFIAATASVDQLRLAGYQALQDVIELFASTPDPDYSGHLLLEQYQAQIGAALRPAFSSDTAPHVTAMACQVCSKWLGSGVSRDVADLRRVQTLLVSSLDKLTKGTVEKSLYGEAVRTMESLAVLKAWAELYIKVTEEEAPRQTDSLEATDSVLSSSAAELVDPHLPLLSRYWLAALKDYALLSLPGQFSSQLPRGGGTFYTLPIIPLVIPYYESNWPSLLHAAAIWAQSSGLTKKATDETQWSSDTSTVPAFAGAVPLATSLARPADERHDLFHLLLGLSVQVLCTPAVVDSPSMVQSSLLALQRLIDTQFSRTVFLVEKEMTMELLSLFRRLLLTCQDAKLKLTTLKTGMLVAQSLKEPATSLEEEGIEDNGDLKEEMLEHGKSLPYSLLELSSCCLLQLIPELALGEKKTVKPSKQSLSPVEIEMMAAAVEYLPVVLSLCSENNLSLVLAPALFMTLSAVRCITLLSPSSPRLTATLQTVRNMCMQLQPSQQTTAVLHSALWSLLGEGKSADSSKMEDIPSETRLVLVAMLLLSPAATCSPGTPLADQCVRFLETCLNSNKAELQLKVLQTCETLFTCQHQQPLATLVIRDLGPSVVELVREKRTEGRVVIRGTQLLLYLLDRTPGEKKATMMSLLVPVLISLLLQPTELRTASKSRRAVHDHVLQKLTQIGPQYPAAFRTAMSSFPDLKSRLEVAVRGQASSRAGHTMASSQKQQHQQPAIKLKMDFSNFK